MAGGQALPDPGERLGSCVRVFYHLWCLLGAASVQEPARKGRWDAVTCSAVGLGSSGCPPA